MFKKMTAYLILLSFCNAKAQISVPFNSLPIEAELTLKKDENTEGVLYASVHTDTVKKCRLWVFYDTSKTKLEVKSVLFEQFLRHKKITNGNYILINQSYISKNIYANLVKENDYWEDTEFLFGSSLTEPLESGYAKSYIDNIRANFPTKARQLLICLKKR